MNWVREKVVVAPIVRNRRRVYRVRFSLRRLILFYILPPLLIRILSCFNTGWSHKTFFRTPPPFLVYNKGTSLQKELWLEMFAPNTHTTIHNLYLSHKTKQWNTLKMKINKLMNTHKLHTIDMLESWLVIWHVKPYSSFLEKVKLYSSFLQMRSSHCSRMKCRQNPTRLQVLKTSSSQCGWSAGQWGTDTWTSCKATLICSGGGVGVRM